MHTRVFDEYIHFEIMYMTAHIFPALTVNYLVNQAGEPEMSHKLSTSMKPSVSNICILFCPLVVQNATTHL